MDQRQTEIREGAGLEESRVNQDFVDFLNKWSTPVLVLILIISAGWWGWQRYQQGQRQELNNAFSELTALSTAQNPNPSSLVGLAETYPDARAVPALAHLAAADAYMDSVVRGVGLGVELGPDGSFPEGEGPLTDEDRQFNLEQAERNYRSALDAAEASAGMELVAVNAHAGLATVAEARGDAEAAKASYERAAAAAGEAGYDLLAGAMEARAAGVVSGELIELPLRADLPELPGTESQRIDLPGPAVVEPETLGPAAVDPALPGSSLSLPGTAPAQDDAGGDGTGDDSGDDAATDEG